MTRTEAGAPVILHTSRMVLRPITAADVDHLVELDSDPLVMRFVSGGTATARAEIAEWVVPRAMAEMRQRPGVGMWAAVDHRSGEFLGWFSLRAPRHSNQPELELTYRLRQAAWGCGLATEGARSLVTFAFSELTTMRLFAGTMAVNRSSRRVMEKCGLLLSSLRLASDRTIPGSERGEVEYELLRSRWEAERFPWAVPLTPAPVAHLIA